MEGMKWKNRLSTRITVVMIAFITVIMAVLCVFLNFLLTSTVSAAIKSEVGSLAESNAKQAETYLESMKILTNVLNTDIGRMQSFSRSEAEGDIKSALTDLLQNNQIFSSYCAFEPNLFFDGTSDGLSYYAYRNGDDQIKLDVLTDYKDYSVGDYYSAPKQSMSMHVTEPYPYQLSNGETVWLITISSPIADRSGKFLGITSCDILADTIRDLPYNTGNYTTSYSYIMTNQGTYVANTADSSQVGSSFQVKNDVGTQILEASRQGKPLSVDGINIYQNNARAWIVLTPVHVEGLDKTWTSAFVVNQSEALKPAYGALILLILIAFAGLVLLAAFSTIYLRKSLSPIQSIVSMAQQMGRGRLNMDTGISVSSKDELGQLSQIIQTTSSTLHDYLDEISYILKNIADGNLDVSVEREYIGDFESIKKSLNHIVNALNDTFGQMHIAANQVSSGAGQVAGGAQALSQGTAEQASAVEELTATAEEISTHVSQSAAYAENVNLQAKNVGNEVERSNQQMQQMVSAMNDISGKSEEIKKIIKTIEDIAFQTNILALNAAVEAARAGSAGKGFAVVADEVRNLAGKSAEAAKTTSALIENTLQSVAAGAEIADETAQALRNSVGGTREILANIGEIASAFQKQMVSIRQVSTGIGQISAVVQMNSATSEESAAASEELSSQAGLLKNMVENFHLKTDRLSSSEVNDPETGTVPESDRPLTGRY